MPSLQSAALYSLDVAAYTTSEGTELLDAAVVSGSFFQTMAGPMAAGRGFGPDDEQDPVAVISDSLARRLFGAPAAALHQPITLWSRAFTIVGVVDPAFRFPEAEIDAWTPAGRARAANPRCCGFGMIGRLAADAPVARAAAEAAAFARTPAGRGATGRADLRATAVGLLDATVAPARPALLVLMAAAGLMLLVACANIVNLLIARRSARARELATRVMLGASRARLIMQSATETTLIAAAGAAAGIALAHAAVAAVDRTGSAGLPRLDDVRLDLPVLLFAAGIAAAAALFTGVVPALRSDSAALIGHGGVTPPPGGRWLRRALCIAEFALSLVLLVGASLLARSLVALVRTDLGVAAQGVVTASMNFRMTSPRSTDEEIRIRAAEVLSALEAVPDVTAAGVGTSLPPSQSRIRITLRREGERVDYQAAGVAATPGYFEALGMRLVRGRHFTPDDDLNHPPVMIMSVETTRRFFGDGDPIGRTMRLPVMRDGVNAGEEMTLVGVVSSVRYSGLDALPDDAVYRPFAQRAWGAPFLVVRTEGDPDALATSLRRYVGAVDQTVVLTEVRTLASIVSDAAAQPRFRTVVLAGMAGLAAAMAAVGLYGVISYSVARRTKEIGVRMALGAERQHVLGLLLREGLGLAAGGALIGIGLALLAVRLLDGLLYGVEPADPVSFGLAATGLSTLTLIASYLPARRAARIDPVAALREQ